MKVRLLDCALAGALAGMASAAAAQDAGDTSALPAPAQPGAGGRAIAWPDGGVVWATEDPVPGERSLSLSVPSSVPFDGTRITAPVEFLARGNYPAFVARYEIAVYRANDADLVAPLAKVPVDVAAVSTARWDGALSAQSGLRTGDALVAVLRAYDAEGHFDETHPRAFQLVAPGSMPMHASHSTGLDATTSLDTALVAESFTHDGLRLRNIPLHGSRIRLQGRNLPPGLTLAIDGAAYPIDRERKFAAEFMVPVGRHDFEITTATQDGKPGPHRTLSLEVTGKYFFGVGLADVTIAHRHVGESVQAPSDQDEWLQQGRLAFYAKAKWRGTYLLTAQADTTERELDQLFDGFGQADPRDIFRRLDPDLYYPTHGDDSTTWRDVDTMGPFYLRLDWDQNQALWGNYATGFTGTELGQYVRSLYGAAVDWRSPGTTAWGDAATTLRAFGSEAQTAPGHNEFLGTGGSLYYLRHTDLLPGSDVVVLEVRDLASGRTESRVRLQRGADYEIDELQGRVLLTRPLAQITRQNLATLTRDAPLDGFEQRLVVDYEWVPSGFDADDIAAGVRAHHWFGDHLGAGVTYVDEIRAGQDYTLAAGDLTLQAGQGTWLKAEYAQSESFGAPVFVSDNGGFSFEQINDTATHREGNARSIDAHVNFRELGWTQRDWSAGAWWRNVGADFAANNFASGLPLSEYGVELLGSLSPALRLHARFSHAESGSDLRLQAQGTLEWRIDDRNTLAGEVRRVDETSSAGASAGVLGALRYTRRIGTASDVYGLVQRTLDDDHGRYADNDALVVGAHHRFADTASLGADLSTGDRGNAASVEGEYRVGAAHTFYGGYTTSTDTPQAPSPFDPKQDDGWTLGQRWRLSDRVTVHNESHYLKEPLQSGLAHTFGLDFLPAQGWNVGMTLQSGELEGSTGLVDRRAASLGGGHQTPATDWHSTLEWRRDTGAEQREQWVGTHRFAYRVNQSWRIAARLNHADTDDHLNAAAGARLVEGNLGFAYRPWNHTRWALFGRYTWLYDLATLAQQGGADVDQKTQVLSFEGVYAHDARWEYAARLARRTGDMRYGRGTGPWFDSGTDFAAAQVRYGLRSHWHALVEYRWQQVDHGGAQRGFLAGVDRDIGPHLRLGAGYNFTDFSDDLTEFGRGHRGWFLDISGRY